MKDKPPVYRSLAPVPACPAQCHATAVRLDVGRSPQPSTLFVCNWPTCVSAAISLDRGPGHETVASDDGFACCRSFGLLCRVQKFLLACAQDMFPNIAAPLTHACWTELICPDGTEVGIQVAPATTVIELFQTELALTQEPVQDSWTDARTGQPLDYYACAAGLKIRASEWTACSRCRVPCASVP